MDWTLLLLLPGLILGMWAQSKVQSTFKKYSGQQSENGWETNDMVTSMMKNENITDVQIEHVAGALTDHYDPSNKKLRLSDATYSSSSIAALGVAAHEMGHVVQHHIGYTPIKIRNSLVPLVNIGSMLSIPLVLAGLLFTFPGLVNIGIALYCAVVLFQLVTLPVELDASRRALAMLSTGNYLRSEEMGPAKEVLGAAAMTYVAALLSSVGTLLRLFAYRSSSHKQ